MDAGKVMPLFDVVLWLQGKWVPYVVAVLAEGPRRSHDLYLEVLRRRAADNRVSDRVPPLRNSSFYDALYRMERDGLIRRYKEGCAERAPVWNELAPVLRDFLNHHAAADLADWAEAHRDFLDGVQRRRQKHEPRAEPE